SGFTFCVSTHRDLAPQPSAARRASVTSRAPTPSRLEPRSTYRCSMTARRFHAEWRSATTPTIRPPTLGDKGHLNTQKTCGLEGKSLLKRSWQLGLLKREAEVQRLELILPPSDKRGIERVELRGIGHPI